MNQNRLFLGCFFSLVATAFGFAIRGAVLEDLSKQFNLGNEQLGWLSGVGLFPFAISIILLSLVIDKIGYGRAMVFAFCGHIISALMTIFASSFEMLYWGTFVFALSNGTVEAVINPVVATVYDKNKTHWLNILHAGWPGGMVLGGLLSIVVGMLKPEGADAANVWRWQMALVLLPTVVYGLLLIGQKFPINERVAAGISYMDMLKEFGWGSSYICFFLLIAGINQTLLVAGVPAISMSILALVALVPTLVFAFVVKSFGRPMFVFLLLVMFLLATTELGTDGWISNIMSSVLNSPTKGTLFLVYTSAIMFVLRFFAGPIVHRISPLGLLTLCAAVACGGLVWLSNAGSASVLLLAATFYAFGKTFFWPTTLGVVSEQFPRGGALMLNAIAGVGMIAVGAIGPPGIGYFQDRKLDELVTQQDATNKTDFGAKLLESKPSLFGSNKTLNPDAYGKLTEEQKKVVDPLIVESKQSTLGKVAVLPGIMFFCYLGLIAYFKSKGGYHAQVLTGHAAHDEEFTGGIEGPVEA